MVGCVLVPSTCTFRQLLVIFSGFKWFSFILTKSSIKFSATFVGVFHSSCSARSRGDRVTHHDRKHFRMRFVKGVCIMGIVCTFVIILSLSASPVLSINDGVGAVELTTTSTSSFPRRMGIGGGDHRHQHREGGAGARISRDELKNRRPASHVPSTSTVTCDGTMEQRPALPPAPDDALQFFTIGDWGVRGLPVGSESQLSVARGMSCVARKHPPKFIATLGGVCFFGGGLGKRRACTS